MLTEKANLGDLGGNLYLSLAYQSRGFLKHDLALSTSVDASNSIRQAYSVQTRLL